MKILSRHSIIATFLLITGGCTIDGLDRPRLSSFEPTENGFRMQASLSALGGGVTEKDHQDWLIYYLEENHICPRGYIITDTKRVVKGDFAATDVFYYGRCK